MKSVADPTGSNVRPLPSESSRSDERNLFGNGFATLDPGVSLQGGGALFALR
jgi:hypothetical protein